MKRIFLLLCVLIFSSYAFSTVTFTTIKQTSNLSNISGVTINFVVTANSTEDLNSQLKALWDNHQYFSTDIHLDANIQKSFDVNDLILAEGNHVVTFKVGSDYKDYLMTIKKGANLVADSIFTEKQAYDIGDTVVVVAVYKNTGDIDVTTPFTVCTSLGLDKKCQVVEEMLRGTTHIYSESFVMSFEGTYNIRTEVDVNNIVEESSESDNVRNSQISVGAKVDLSIIADDIVVGDAVERQLTNVTFIIKNLGIEAAKNVDVTVWHTVEDIDNLIYSNTYAEVTGNSSKTVTFSYYPMSAGTDIIIVSLDGLNKIVETDETNNKAIKSYVIANKPIEDLNANTLFFEIDSDCIAFFSNNQKLISEGISFDENGNNAVLNLKLIAADGDILIDGNYAPGEEEVLPGVTLRLLEVTDMYARLMLIYQQKITLLYNSCVIDVIKVKQDREYYINQFGECQEQLIENKLDLSECQGSITSNADEVNRLNNELSTCNQNKDSLSTQVVGFTESCELQKSAVQDECEEKAKSDVAFVQEKYDNEKSLRENAEAQLTVVGLLALIIICAITVSIFYKLKKKNEVS